MPLPNITPMNAFAMRQALHKYRETPQAEEMMEFYLLGECYNVISALADGRATLTEREEGEIHHTDNDPLNNDPDNLGVRRGR